MTATDAAAFWRLWEDCEPWRRFLLRRHWAVEDAAAEIQAAAWERFVAGGATQRDLFAAASVRLRRVTRHQARRQATTARNPRGGFVEDHEFWPTFGDDGGITDLVEQIAAEAILADVEIPARVRPWVRRVTGGPTVTDLDMWYGRSWASRTRTQLRGREVSDAA